MKIPPLVLALFACLAGFASEIDKLQSNHDVNNFLIRKVDKNFTVMPLSEDYRPTPAAGWGRDKFFKVDIDQNGLTDLVVYGKVNFFVVLDNGDKYSVHYIETWMPTSKPAALVLIDTVSNPRKIIIQRPVGLRHEVEALVFKFNGLIEYNPKPAPDLIVQQIGIATGSCLGSCPIFELVISKDRAAWYKAIYYNDITGNFKGTIPAKEYQELITLLQYIQLNKLSSEYAVEYTDAPSVTTTIIYNGKTKVIRDYGKKGTFGLSLLYAKLFSLRKLVDWTKQ